MALFKSSKKTTKAASEAPSKGKTTVAATKAQTATDKPLKEVASIVAPKSRRATPQTISTDVPAQEVVQAVPVQAAPKTMAAAAGQGEVLNGLHASASNGVSRDAIAHRAYLYFEERGFAHGFAEEDWARAEADLKNS